MDVGAGAGGGPVVTRLAKSGFIGTVILDSCSIQSEQSEVLVVDAECRVSARSSGQPQCCYGGERGKPP